MKNTSSEWDSYRKIRRVEKGTNKVDKYRKSIYNMLSEEDLESYDDGLDSDTEESEVNRNEKRR
jgi:hypothetical protein